MYTSWWCHLF